MINPIDLKSNFSKFKSKSFRPYQEDAINFALESNKLITVIWGPTGFGKSLAANCIGAAHSNFTYLVGSKQLQNQLQSDFPEIEILKGRSNYPCNLSSELTCAECIHSSLFKCPHKHGDCTYDNQKALVLNSPYRLLNYAYFLTEANFVGKFSNQKILLCDEADSVESLLTDFISLSIPGYVFKKLNIKKPKYKTLDASHKLLDTIKWVEGEASDKVSNGLSKVSAELKSIDKDHPDSSKLLKRQQSLKTILGRFKIFSEYADESWIMEYQKSYNKFIPETLMFKPIWTPSELSEKYFFRHAKKFVFLSATFPPVQIMGRLLGRDPNDIDYIDIPSNFPEENRKIFLNPVGNITAKTFDAEAKKVIYGYDILRKGPFTPPDTAKHIPGIKDIINFPEHLNQKALIHCVSYKFADMILGIGDPRIGTHNSKNREEVLDKFIRSRNPLILVSPSMERGVDLPDDLCRFIIFAKCPFLNLGDKLTSRRVYSGNLGNLWYKSLTAQTIVQGCGRGVRSKTDYCVTYMMDKQISDLIMRNGSLFPGYFRDAIQIY